MMEAGGMLDHIMKSCLPEIETNACPQEGGTLGVALTRKVMLSLRRHIGVFFRHETYL